MIFKCKICGGTLDVKQGEQVAVCEYCGVRQSIPSFIEPKTEKIYNRANNYLMHNEFDKAENLFNQILFDDNSNADVYWNVLMCRYGVSYVKDPASGKYIPTCNRTLYTPIFNDENYKKALEYADEAQKELYVADAQIIDEIQKQILSVSKHEKPFDIFISYKETEINGMRTQDSIKAQELYDRLTAEGYKVFFSRITLEDKAGTEYEPYIYAALASSKVMLTISSTKENIEAVWVKNEWSRYLSFASKETDKTLIPLYFDMDSSDLPEEFAHLPAYDMSVNGFEQELIRGIKKLIPLPVMLFEQRKRRNKILKKIGIGAVSCAIIGLICSIPWFMKLPDYNAAMQLYYDKNYPEATWAFDQLGGYRDSKEMQDKCEKSWRNSVSNIIAEDKYKTPVYYINPNGMIDTFNSASGTLHQKYDINEHGKIVSIELQGSLAALYEDGYVNVINGYYTNENKDLNDIIKISPHFLFGVTVLKNDGTMEIIKSQEGEFLGKNFLDNLVLWENIVDFDYSHPFVYSGGNMPFAVIAGITNDKTLKIAKYNQMDFKNEYLYDRIIDDKFINIKKVDVDIDYNGLYIVALTYNNKILTYVNGVFNSCDVSDVVDICLRNDVDGSIGWYELHSDGKLYENGKNNYIISDVIYIEDKNIVTRSGSIYILNEGVPEQTEGKTRVLEEWIERMN